MQDIFANNPAARTAFINLASRERFDRYLLDCAHDEARAAALYRWNMLISQSLYIYLQCWEIALRNRLNAFLCWKYNSSWPYDESRLIRNMTRDDRNRLAETRHRQQRQRRLNPAPTSMIVADLTAGFWVSQLSKPYEAHYRWKYNLSRIFPNAVGLDRPTAWTKCEGVLRLRNRVAHHEPIYRLPLQDLYQNLEQLVGAMCPATKEFAQASCNFRQVWGLWHPPASAHSGEVP